MQDAEITEFAISVSIEIFMSNPSRTINKDEKDLTLKRFHIESANSQQLTAYCYESVTPLKAGVVIGPAIAVKQSFYSSFASYLAAQGFRVWTFDYDGIGESQHASMRYCDANVSSWLYADYELVVQHASDTMADLPLFVLGHSLGGQIAPMLPSLSKLSGIINISVGSGARRHMSPRLKRLTPLLWHVIAPALCSVCGYFPGAKVGIMGDIPKNAMSQWKEWCLDNDYLLGAEPDATSAYASVTCPIFSLFFTDDELLAESGASWLHQAFTKTSLDYRVVKASDFDSPGIGHFGFFKNRHREQLWPLVSRWLDSQTGKNMQ